MELRVTCDGAPEPDVTIELPRYAPHCLDYAHIIAECNARNAANAAVTATDYDTVGRAEISHDGVPVARVTYERRFRCWTWATP